MLQRHVKNVKMKTLWVQLSTDDENALWDHQLANRYYREPFIDVMECVRFSIQIQWRAKVVLQTTHGLSLQGINCETRSSGPPLCPNSTIRVSPDQTEPIASIEFALPPSHRPVTRRTAKLSPSALYYSCSLSCGIHGKECSVGIVASVCVGVEFPTFLQASFTGTAHSVLVLQSETSTRQDGGEEEAAWWRPTCKRWEVTGCELTVWMEMERRMLEGSGGEESVWELPKWEKA